MKGNQAPILYRDRGIINPAELVWLGVFFNRQFQLVDSFLRCHVHTTAVVNDDIEGFALVFYPGVEDVGAQLVIFDLVFPLMSCQNPPDHI